MNPTKLTRTTLLAAALLALAGNAALRAQAMGGAPALAPAPAAPLLAPVQTMAATEYRGAAALGLELRRLGTTGRVLMIGAHPDDENNPMLTRLALGEGATVAYLSLTRGEGGQNAIGADFQEALGILRSEELLAARRLDAAGQFFGREYDFGFSKTAAESFQHWPRDAMLSDVVRIIRLYRPDVVVSVWTGTPRDGHGQHQVSGIVAKEAFDAAADPSRYPEQLREGLAPWAARKLYEGAYFMLDSATVRLNTGEMDPLLGMSYAQVAAISRARHRSQDQGQALPLGPRVSGLRLVVDRSGPTPAGPHPESGLFQGLDTTLTERAARALGPAAPACRLFAAYDSAMLAARAAFDPLRPDALVPPLARAVRALAAAEDALPDSPAGASLRAYPARAYAGEALTDAAGLVFDAVASREQVVPGDSVDIDVSVWNGGSRPVGLTPLTVLAPAGWTVTPQGRQGTPPLAPGALETVRFRVAVPADAPVTEPYYLRLPRQGDLYAWPAGDPADGLPFQPPPIRAAGAVTVEGATVPFELPASFRAVNPREGEIRRPLRIVPAVSVETDRAMVVLPLPARAPLPLDVRVTAQDRRGASGTLHLTLPAGWRAAPAQAALQLGNGETRTVRFQLTPPATLPAGGYEIAAGFRDAAGREYARGYRLIDYPHIRPHPLYRAATTTVQALDVAVPRALRVAYIMGAGDEVPAALAQLGLHVEPLAPAALGTADLSRFDDIVVGVRAYEVHPELAAANARLLDWVREGGTLIVQYQQAAWAQSGMPPYPLQFNGRMGDRVTDETAPVTVLQPASPALTRPNRITPADWQGWVQERGLWYPRTWDPKYSAPIEMADPGEAPSRGSLLIAPLGKGTYVYTGLSLFRELPAGVPGAFRLFANLLALGHSR